MTITFIGGGNMATSLIGGLLDAGTNATDIMVSDPAEAVQQRLSTDFGVNISVDNAQAIAPARVVVLAVKPQQMHTVLSNTAGLYKNKLIISVAAGVGLADIAKWSGDEKSSVVRCMPNTPALLGCGATGLIANEQVTQTQKKQAETIISAAGISEWVDDESQLDAITALSGSGPAYFFLLMEAMTDSAIKMGIPEDLAGRFARQTALGAARMACEGELPAAQLRRNVTSPAGTTEAAINSFENDHFSQIVHHAMQAAQQRAQQLGRELGAQHG